MDSFRSVFSEPLPQWVTDIKNEARAKIGGASFAQRCREGDRTVMRSLVVGLWPFVDQFPMTLIRGAARLVRLPVSQKREILNTLLHRGSEILAGIRNDESNHRKLWIHTGEALGLQYPSDFTFSPLPETGAWMAP